MSMQTGPAPSEEGFEDRLRRTFAVRARDIAPGDGVLPPGIVQEPDGQRPDGDALHLPGPASPRRSPRARRADTAVRRHRRRALAVAAALIVAGGSVATVLRAVGGSDDGRDATDTDAGPAADDPDPAPPTTLAAGSTYEVGVFSRGQDERLDVSFEASAVDATTLDVAALLGDQWRPVQAGPHHGYAAVTPGEANSQVWLLFEDGIVRLFGGSLASEDLLAAAATVTRDRTTGRYTMPTPQGWTAVPGDATVSGPGRRNSDGVPVGHFGNGDGAFYGAIWYSGWTAENIPADAERVDVTAGPAHLGSVARDASDLLQLWIRYEDGVLELQATRMTRDELIAAGNGVARTPDTDTFTLTPPAGYITQPAVPE